MRKILLVAFLCALPAHAAERVLDFHSDIRIAANGEVAVTERIVVQAGGEAASGIVRDIPGGPFAVQRVMRNGKPEPYAVELAPGRVRIRTGRPETLAGHERHVYEIAYRTSRRIGFYGDRDELHWNVSGNAWPFAVERISAEVRLPAKVDARELKLEAYTGLAGAQGRNFQTLVHDAGAAFRSTRPFAPKEGMTIVVGFPKGVVEPPSAAQRARWFLADHALVLAGLGALALLGGGLMWWRRLTGKTWSIPD